MSAGPYEVVAANGVVGLELQRVAGWVDGHTGGFLPPLRIERVGSGQSNLTFLVSDGTGRRWILRRPPVGPLLPSAHDVAREARIMSALGSTAVPVPDVLAVTHGGEAYGAPMVLMTFVDGVVLDSEPAVESLAESVRWNIGLSVAQTLARVHDVDTRAVGLGDLSSHSPYALRQLRRWSTQWEKSKTAEQPLLDELTARLTAAAPAQNEIRLVHGDLHLSNVIVAGDTGLVAAAVDWELCTLGDPLADLGTLLAYWPTPQEAHPKVFAAPAYPGFPRRADIVEEYVRETGRDVSNLGFWHTLALWKIAIICEGIVRRTLDNPRNRAARGIPDRTVVNAFVDRAHAQATAAGF